MLHQPSLNTHSGKNWHRLTWFCVQQSVDVQEFGLFFLSFFFFFLIKVKEQQIQTTSCLLAFHISLCQSGCQLDFSSCRQHQTVSSLLLSPPSFLLFFIPPVTVVMLFFTSTSFQLFLLPQFVFAAWEFLQHVSK